MDIFGYITNNVNIHEYEPWKNVLDNMTSTAYRGPNCGYNYQMWLIFGISRLEANP